MHYVAAGLGPLVILLHGFPETHRSWDFQVPALVDAGFRTITPDLRGYGSTERPRDGYDLGTLGRDIAALIDHVAEAPVFLVGHDWGGAVAWHVATRFPERLRRVVVLNCPHPARFAEALATDPDQLRRSWYMLFFQLPVLPEWWLTRRDGANLVRLFRSGFRHPHAAPSAIAEASRRALIEPDAARAAIGYYRAALRPGVHPWRLRKALRSYGAIRVPVTIIWGRNDPALATRLVDGTERFAPDLDVTLVPGAGHFVHQEKPETVNSLLVDALARGQERKQLS